MDGRITFRLAGDDHGDSNRDHRDGKPFDEMCAIDLLAKVRADERPGETRQGKRLPSLTEVRYYHFPDDKARAEEIVAALKARVFGEDLVVFRDSDGRVGVLDEKCPHRRASLVYGRNEEGGLRCLYHGWKMDVAGNVLEMVSEPAASGIPRSSTARHAYASRIRSGPSRCSAHGMSLVAWVGCIDAITRSGTIVKSYIAEGQSVKAGEKMFEIADFTKMWFHAMIPEQDVPFIKAGQIVKLHTASLPGVTLTSRIYNISPNLDDMSRSAKIRVVIENPERKIKNNLFAEGDIHIEAEETLTVPRSAVLWPGNAPRVYVEKQTGHFEPRSLKLGRVGDTDYEVLEGLKAGENVVTSGNMLMDSQAQLNHSSTAAP